MLLQAASSKGDGVKSHPPACGPGAYTMSRLGLEVAAATAASGLALGARAIRAISHVVGVLRIIYFDSLELFDGYVGEEARCGRDCEHHM